MALSMKRIRARLFWRRLHVYIALTVGFMFAFSGLTGSALVFYKALDEAFNPELFRISSEGAAAPLRSAVQSAQRVVPASATLTRLYLPQHAQAPLQLRYSDEQNGERHLLDVMVDPISAEVLGQREWGGYLMSFIYKLHYTLWLGETGKSTIGILGLLLLCSLLSGLYLWWPRGKKRQRAFVVQRGKSLLFDLHRVVGAYVAIGLLVIAISGVYMIFPKQANGLISYFSMVESPAPGRIETGETMLDLDQIYDIAQRHFPHAALQHILLPAQPEQAYRIIMRQPGEARKTSGATQLWISPYSGDILAQQQPQVMSLGQRLTHWMYPLHNGEALGMTGRLVVFGCGLSLFGLYISGVWLWLRKRRPNHASPRPAPRQMRRRPVG